MDGIWDNDKNSGIEGFLSKIEKLLKEGLNPPSGGIPKVYNFKAYNSERVFYLHGHAKHLTIHNSGSSDIVISFPDSAGNYYTIPSGNDNANPLVIADIAPGLVDKLIIRSNGVESVVEVVALLWDIKRGE